MNNVFASFKYHVITLRIGNVLSKTAVSLLTDSLTLRGGNIFIFMFVFNSQIQFKRDCDPCIPNLAIVSSKNL